MQRPMPKLDRLWFGANYWSSTGGPLMWRNYDPDLVRSELGVLAEHGLNLTRSFFYWPDFHPEPDRIDEELCRHFADFLDAHTELGMTTIGTFIVGHMSGENWDPVWRGGRDLYTDVWMVGRQAWYIEQLTGRFHDHPAVAGWLISNEMPIYGGQASSEQVSAWARLMVQAVRAGGGRQPVSIGDGAWGEEVTGVVNGFSVRDLAGFTDFVGPHVYKMESDVVRQHLKAAFVCELAAIAEKPVVMEEFGLSSDFVSPENSGHYYRQLLHTTLLAGASGWIAWNNTDYDKIAGQRPYNHHPFELHFGITEADGTPKPPLLEMQSFARTLERIDVTNCRRSEADTAIVVSSYLADGYDFLDPGQRQLVAAHAEQAYIAAREADLRVAVLREPTDGGIVDGCSLYLLPSVKELTTTSWRRLGEIARAGAVGYVSYCVGESEFQRGPWWNATAELFGVTNDLVYGLADRVIDDTVTFTMTENLGSLKVGDTLRFTVAGNEHSRSFLPVTVGPEATVLATDQHGRPALVAKRHGPGLMVLCTYPLEHFAARTRGVNPEDTWRLYQALAEEAGVRREVRVDDPRVMVDTLVHSDGRRFHFLLSQSAEPLDVWVRTDDATPAHLTSADGEAVTSVHLPPYGVEVLHTDAEPTRATRKPTATQEAR